MVILGSVVTGEGGGLVTGSLLGCEVEGCGGGAELGGIGE